MGTCMHFSRSLPSNSWWQTMVGCQVLSRPPAAEGGGRRPAFTGLAIQPYSATEVDGWQHKAQPGVSKPGRSTQIMVGPSPVIPDPAGDAFLLADRHSVAAPRRQITKAQCSCGVRVSMLR